MSDQILLSLSGGKDSAACGLLLKERGIPFTSVFNDTGWEHASTYRYLDEVLEHRFGPIVRLSGEVALPPEVLPRVLEIESVLGISPSPMVRWIAKKGMFPSRVRRYCTQELKVRPFLAWAEVLEVETSVVGIRAEESAARSTLPEREPMPGAEWLEVWRPLLRWSLDDVIAIHKRHDLPPNPLYLQGSNRVGCWPCVMARKGEIRAIADNDPARIEVIRMLELLVANLARARNPDLVGLPAWFQSPLKQPDGAYPCWPIDRVVAWSRTARGGRQMEIFAPSIREDGCMRWGLCETPTVGGGR